VVLSSTCILTVYRLLIGGGTDGAGSRSALTIGRGPPPADGQVGRQDPLTPCLKPSQVVLISTAMQTLPAAVLWPGGVDIHVRQAGTQSNTYKFDGANKMRGGGA